MGIIPAIVDAFAQAVIAQARATSPRQRALARFKYEQQTFLIEYGWRQIGQDAWASPPGYDVEPRSRSFVHAINSQLWTLRTSGEWYRS